MKTVIEMAREAGIRDCTCNGTVGCLERFAELVREQEREACENVVNGYIGCDPIVDAIRARGNT